MVSKKAEGRSEIRVGSKKVNLRWTDGVAWDSSGAGDGNSCKKEGRFWRRERTYTRWRAS